METHIPNSANHEIHPVETMQVKRRINQFFGNILRKDKVQQQLEDEQEPTFASSSSSSQVKNKQKHNKSNQSYSQWDLMEHMAGEPVEDEPARAKSPQEDNIIYSDGLGYYTEVSLEDLHGEQKPIDEYTRKKQRSFLKRSGSLLRKSLRRSKKKSKNDENEIAGGGNCHMIDTGSLTNVVQELNATILEVAAFGDDENGQIGQSGSKPLDHENQNKKGLSENNTLGENSSSGANNIFTENGENFTFFDHRVDKEWSQEARKAGLTNGLKRQASKLASKLQRTPAGSVRLEPTVSMESFPNINQKRKASMCTNAMAGPVENTDLSDDVKLKKTASFRRKLSFKHAKKAMKNGVTSLGKSMIHASAVMPIAYESPPVSFYPDRNDEDDEYPQHLVQCYYRTISYQPKDCRNGNNDNSGQQHGHCARPTSFYQHGYCYNG